MFTEEENMDGKKIKYFRLKNGLTSEELANRVGCTKAAISLYESEEREPSEEISKKIAEVLGVPWIELFSRANSELKFNHISFRKKQKASKKDIEILKYEIESQCANRVELLDILGLTIEKPFKPKKLSFDDKPEDNAKKIRTALGLSLSGPIYSITNILEHAGVIVLSFECADEIDGLNGTVNNIPYIFFNSKNRTIERQRFTIVHEVCHLFFNDAEDNKEIEKYINQVAGSVLVPADDIYWIFGRVNRNITIYLRNDVAKRYKVAPSCLINRLLETGVVIEMYHKKFFILLNKFGGKKFEKTQLDLLRDSEEPTIFTQQVYLALSETLITASKAAEFLHIPLYDVMQNMRVE